MTLQKRAYEVGVRALHDRLSEHLEHVQGGAEVLVTRRGRPIARLSAVKESDPLQELVQRGLVTAPSRQRTARRTLVKMMKLPGLPQPDPQRCGDAAASVRVTTLACGCWRARSNSFSLMGVDGSVRRPVSSTSEGRPARPSEVDQAGVDRLEAVGVHQRVIVVPLGTLHLMRRSIN